MVINKRMPQLTLRLGPQGGMVQRGQRSIVWSSDTEASGKNGRRNHGRENSQQLNHGPPFRPSVSLRVQYAVKLTLTGMRRLLGRLRIVVPEISFKPFQAIYRAEHAAVPNGADSIPLKCNNA